MKIFIQVEVPDDFEMGNIKAVELREAIDLGYWQQVSGEAVCKVGAHWNTGGGFDVRNFTSQPPCGTPLFAAPSNGNR